MVPSTSWDRAAASYDASRAGDPVYASCLQFTAQNVPEGTRLCLDAGAGTGLSSAALSSRCDTVVAIDYSLESLKQLQRKGLANVLAVQANITALPFRDSTFDACVCANTLQHLGSDGPRTRAIEELQRVTRRTGVLGISVHHYSRSKRKAGWIKEGRPGQAGIDYIFRYTWHDLRAAVPGATIHGIGYYGLARFPLIGRRLQARFASAFGRIAARLGIGHMLVAVLRLKG